MKVLHAGCGRQHLPEWMKVAQEVRLDIDSDASPDICASLTELGDIGQYAAVYCSHALEHLTLTDIKKALAEFYRVIADQGALIIMVPDMEGIEPTDDVVYMTEDGISITGLDMFYGWQVQVDANPYMSHKYAFTKKTLCKVIEDCGFTIKTCLSTQWNLLAVATK